MTGPTICVPISSRLLMPLNGTTKNQLRLLQTLFSFHAQSQGASFKTWMPSKSSFCRSGSTYHRSSLLNLGQKQMSTRLGSGQGDRSSKPSMIRHDFHACAGCIARSGPNTQDVRSSSLICAPLRFFPIQAYILLPTHIRGRLSPPMAIPYRPAPIFLQATGGPAAFRSTTRPAIERRTARRRHSNRVRSLEAPSTSAPLVRRGTPRQFPRPIRHVRPR